MNVNAESPEETPQDLKKLINELVKLLVAIESQNKFFDEQKQHFYNFTNEMQDALESLTNTEVHVKQQLKDAISTFLTDVTDNLEKRMDNFTFQSLHHSLENFHRVSESAKDTIRVIEWQSGRQWMRGVIYSVISGVVASLFCGWLFLPKNIFSDVEKRYYENGKLFSEKLEMLSEKEKNKVLELLKLKR